MASSGGNRGGAGGGSAAPPPPPGQSPQSQAAQRAADEALDEASKVFFDGLQDKLRKTGEYTWPLLNAMQGLQTVFQGLSAVSQVAHLALDGFSTAVQAVSGQIGGLVKLANPGVLDQFQRAFAAFQAQLGETFAPLLQGLGQLVQTVANALAGLTPQGRGFIVFLAGAAAGLGVAITVGGIFLTVLGAVAGAMVAGAAAGEALGVALDFASAGAASIGQLIGAALGGIGATGLVAGAGAGAGGLTALAVAGGTIEQFQQAIGPFLETLVGAFNQVGATALPQLGDALKRVTPALNDLLVSLAEYIPPLTDVLVAATVDILPEFVGILATLAKEFLPIARYMSVVAVQSVEVAGALAQLVRALTELQAAAVAPGLRRLFGGLGSVTRAPSGQAPAPVTGASYTGIEDLFRKSQEAAVLGKPGGDDPFKNTMNDRSVQNSWAQAITHAALGPGSPLGPLITAAMAAAGGRTP